MTEPTASTGEASERCRFFTAPWDCAQERASRAKHSEQWYPDGLGVCCPACPSPAPSGDALDDGPFCHDCGAGQHELVAERERAAAEKGYALDWTGGMKWTNPYAAERGAQ